MFLLNELNLLSVFLLQFQLQAFAYESGNVELAKEVKASKSDIDRLKESDIAPLVKKLIHTAKDNLVVLTEFGITENNLSDILASLEDFNQLIGKPRTILNQKYSMLNTMDSLITEANKLLREKLDNLILIFRESNPDFFSAYARARTIADAF